MSGTSRRGDHWPRHARQWALVGAPLRPGADDVHLAETAVDEWAAASGRAPRALLLGVTPELATLRWPAGTTLLAVDRSAAMIEAIFPAAGTGAGAGTPAGAMAVPGEWLALPVGAHAVDVALGDGCLSNLEYPGAYRGLAAELRRVLAEDGRLVLRLFAAPEHCETVDEIAGQLAAGRIGSFHALKWRLAMAIQQGDRNVRVVEIGRAFDRIAPDRPALARRTGWPIEVIATIDAYRESELVYSFPTLAEVRRALADDLVELACHTPTYELGDRCPTLVFRPR